jgi:AcrR family transcriptional regulator
MSRQGEQTRQALIDAAEQLFAARGVSTVPLGEVTASAGQRNTSAVNFHFDDRDGLLAAIQDRHLPQIAARAEEIYERIAADGLLDTTGGQVEVIFGPTIDYLTDGSSARAWLRIVAQRQSQPGRGSADLVDIATPRAIELGTVLITELQSSMSAEMAVWRIAAASTMVMHLCADRAAALESTTPPPLAHEEFREALLDMVSGALEPSR